MKAFTYVLAALGVAATATAAPLTEKRALEQAIDLEICDLLYLGLKAKGLVNADVEVDLPLGDVIEPLLTDLGLGGVYDLASGILSLLIPACKDHKAPPTVDEECVCKPNVPLPSVPQTPAPHVPETSAPHVPETSAPHVPEVPAPHVPEVPSHVPETEAPKPASPPPYKAPTTY